MLPLACWEKSLKRPPVARGLAAFSLFAAIAFPATSWAEEPVSPPHSFGRDPGKWASGKGWYLHLGAAQRDTLPTALRTAILAARAALEEDDWVVEPSRAADRQLITRWKPIKNFIFRRLAGDAFGRCFVDVQALPGDSVLVTFQAGLATRRDIEHSPVRVLADDSYATAARDWQRAVRELLAGRPSSRKLVKDR